jgi:hypothetical protein
MTKPRPNTFHVGPEDASSMTTNYVTIAHQVSSNDAFPSAKVRHHFLTFMKEYVGIMLHKGAWSVKPFGKVFTGR